MEGLVAIFVIALLLGFIALVATVLGTAMYLTVRLLIVVAKGMYRLARASKTEGRSAPIPRQTGGGR